MTPDELQQREETLGRQIAAALAPLGISEPNIRRFARFCTDVLNEGTEEELACAARLRVLCARKTARKLELARIIGVAAYFEALDQTPKGTT